jgi:hypothetical protein
MNVGAKHLAEAPSIIPGLASKCFARPPKEGYYGRLGPMPVFILGKNFAIETKIGLYPNLLRRAASGNTGKAFGDEAWNIHPHFCQMLYPYVRPPKSIAIYAKGKLLMMQCG